MTMCTPAISPRPLESSSRGSTSHGARKPMTIALPASNAPVLTPRRNDARTPSPNYFGLHVDPNVDCFATGAAQHIRANWSPPSSNVRSTAAASPRVVPIDQNPEFEAFRRQSENNKAFALPGRFEFGSTPSPATVPPQASQGGFFGPPKTPVSPTNPIPNPIPVPPQPLHTNNSFGDFKDAALRPPKPRSPKRMLSSDTQMLTDRPRRESPASFLDSKGFGRTDAMAEFAAYRDVRPSLPPIPSFHPTPPGKRSDSLPAVGAQENANGPTMASPQHIVNILESAVDEVLLLDLRVSTQYAKSRIACALSLCIPTTLLKRASFTVQKLADTFKEGDDKDKFERWRSSKYIIVYDSSASHLKDAATCVHTLNKFTAEGWTGGLYIIRGGFAEFSKAFPSYITSASGPSQSASSGLRIDSDGPAVAPVAGGCPMPLTQNAANPFFGNIRQNMDLIGGVGQMSVKKPAGLSKSIEDELPSWLRVAADEHDHGKSVSDKFLRIEKREQKRMQEALSSSTVSFGPPHGRADPAKGIQIAGIEKGSKNRYNSIWPYEHSRVKLEGVTEGGCDYINANHITTSRSNKRYIATQGPLPATFNDFWNVVWQQDVRVVVMLTAESEGGQLKAHNYWSDRQYGHLYLNGLGEHRASLEPHRIHRRREQSKQRSATHPPKPTNLSRESSSSSTSASAEQPYVIVRKFTLSNSEEPFERMREITQLQYSSWPDFGAPAHPAHLLGLIEQCDAVVRQVNGGSASRPDPPNARPVLVHCSAGCGRTGTFCTVDTVIDMLKRQRQARNARQGTPMDVDTAVISPTQSHEGGFFDNEPTSDGNWAFKDDADLIENTVEDFRLQRLSMVQSLRQFVLCYESVLEWLVEQQPKSA